MGRLRRLEYPGGLWHVTNRGVEKRQIFLDARDGRTFLRSLADAIPRFRWRLHAYVLMSNHYHLLIETVEPTLSRGMQRLGGDYADFFNWRHERTGHLFQGRFKAHLIDTDTYLLEVARYIVLNPVRARLVASPEEWRWSSYNATAGLEPAPPWLTIATILSRFGSLKPAEHYRGFVAAGIGNTESPWKGLVDQMFLGSAAFVERVQSRFAGINRSVVVEEIARAVVEVTGTSPEVEAPAFVRLAYAALARDEALASLRDIGTTLGIGATGARYLVQRAASLQSTDDAFRELVEQVRAAIRR
jgi:putative transposase